MASTLETLVVRLTADATKLEQELNQQVRKSETAGQKIGRAFGIASRSLLGLGTAAAGAASALTLAANRAAGYADEVDKAAIRTRLARSTVQELRFVADQAGGSFQAIEQNIRAFTGRIAEAERGSKTLGGTFAKLGVALKDNNGNLRDTESLFLDTLNALSRVENETERAALAVSAFGETGTELLPIISQGAGGIEELRQKARDLGIVLDDQSVSSLVAYKDQLSRVQQQFGAVQRELATVLLPVLTDKLLPAIEKGIDIFRAMPEPLQRAAGGATALGTGFSAAAVGARLLGVSLAPLLGPTGLLVAGGLLAVAAFAAALSGNENSIESAAERAAKAVAGGDKNSLKGALGDLQGYLDNELSSSIQGVIDLLNTMALSAVGTRVLMEVAAGQAASLARVAEIDAEIERLRNPSRFEVMVGERTGITPEAKIAELVAERNRILAAVNETTELAQALAESGLGIFEGSRRLGGGGGGDGGAAGSLKFLEEQLKAAQERVASATSDVARAEAQAVVDEIESRIRAITLRLTGGNLDEIRAVNDGREAEDEFPRTRSAAANRARGLGAALGRFFRDNQAFLEGELDRERARFQSGLPGFQRRFLPITPTANVGPARSLTGFRPLAGFGLDVSAQSLADSLGNDLERFIRTALQIDLQTTGGDRAARERALARQREEAQEVERFARARETYRAAVERATAADIALGEFLAFRFSITQANFRLGEDAGTIGRAAFLALEPGWKSRASLAGKPGSPFDGSWRARGSGGVFDGGLSKPGLDAKVAAANEFAETVAGAAFSFTENLIGAIRSGDIGEAFRAALGAGQSILGSANLGTIPFLGGSLGIGALLSGVLGIFAALIPRGAGESEATRALGANTRGAPAVEFNVTVNQSLSIASLTGEGRRAVDGLLNDTASRLEAVITRNVLPRLGYLEERIA